MSLLIRLARPGPQDERAWREFVDYYAPVIYQWCIRRRVQDSDARDVTQQVLLRLATRLPRFTYDPSKSFRAWLRTITYHAWVDFIGEGEAKGSGNSTVLQLLATVEAREELLHKIEGEFDLELLEIAVDRVKERVEPATWESFRLTAFDGVPAGEVAKRLGKKVATIYVSRRNVQKMLQAEVAALKIEFDSSAAEH